jgi:hypothetical protein
LGAKGLPCELWIDPPDQVWHDFQYDVDETILLLEGDLQIEMTAARSGCWSATNSRSRLAPGTPSATAQARRGPLAARLPRACHAAEPAALLRPSQWPEGPMA